ncbi:glycine cleavage system protein GcvH [Thermus filiformis]|uniref:Glycine cleavage system H protein n=1 Tax=Thermus filiformis TaxID=276 RepID=A0A0D6XBU1_THEFI|nr:glycine cleavage system protein GcvH [Thermus filiformis]KIX84796.1 glycine cleavage system protein H [Thermus filiformis]
MDAPKDRFYTKTHEWALPEGDEVVVGITDYAQEQLGDVVYVELPQVGRKVAAQEAVAVVESVKTASDIYAPVAGVVVAVNEALTSTPELINQDPYGEGWIFKLKPDNLSDLDGLLDAEAYLAGLEE